MLTEVLSFWNDEWFSLGTWTFSQVRRFWVLVQLLLTGSSSRDLAGEAGARPHYSRWEGRPGCPPDLRWHLKEALLASAGGVGVLAPPVVTTDRGHGLVTSRHG